MIVVLAEKPSVARDIAAVLGASARCNGYLEGARYRVTWAIGHLVGLAQPGEIHESWKAWARTTLPMLPEQFPLRVLDDGAAQYKVVERLLRARDTTSIIAATDAGREGELIFRLIYERASCTKPWQRLWLSSMTRAAIQNAFAKLEPGTRYDDLAAAARARSEADWLVGMNLSRAYTLTNGTLFSVGRVQTPTLALVVKRDREIRTFTPQHYIEVEAAFASAKGEYKGIYYAVPAEGLRDERGKLRPFQAAQTRLPADGRLAAAIVERTRAGRGVVHAIEQTTRRTPPPQLFDLTTLQREANRLFGYSAQQTLEAAQALYEQHKALSYPRTDSRHLSTDVSATLAAVVNAIAPLYGELVAPSSGGPLGSRWVNDAKVRDHHALIPTPQCPSLPPDSTEARIYDLVCRRLLMAWHADRIESITRLLTRVEEGAVGKDVDLFATQGITVESLGWSVLATRPLQGGKAEELSAPMIPPGLVNEDMQRVEQVKALSKQTQPPKPHSDETLLSAMESAGRHVEDEVLREAMRECGLGTPATRAATIETLLSRGYLDRTGKALRSTALGEALIDAVHPLVASAEMTGRWERRLREMERGGETPTQFRADIAAYVREVVATEALKPRAPLRREVATPNRTRRHQRDRAAKRAARSKALRPPRAAGKS